MSDWGGMYMLLEREKLTPRQRGGHKRCATADQDMQGRLMPADKSSWRAWQLDSEHGRRGGAARTATAMRNERGRFIAAEVKQ